MFRLIHVMEQLGLIHMKHFHCVQYGDSLAISGTETCGTGLT